MTIPDFNRAEWISIVAVAISLAAITFTALQYRVARRRDLREMGHVEPIVEFDMRWPKFKLNPWRELEISIKNRAEYPLYLERISFAELNAALIVGDGDCSEFPAGDLADVNARAQRSVRLNRRPIAPGATTAVKAFVAFDERPAATVIVSWTAKAANARPGEASGFLRRTDGNSYQ